MSLPHDVESGMRILNRVPWPFLSVGRQRQRPFFASSTSTSGPPVTRILGSPTRAPEARCPAFATGDAVFLARSIRHTVLFWASSTYGAPSEPWTSEVSLTGWSAGNWNTSFERTATTP